MTPLIYLRTPREHTYAYACSATFYCPRPCIIFAVCVCVCAPRFACMSHPCSTCSNHRFYGQTLLILHNSLESVRGLTLNVGIDGGRTEYFTVDVRVESHADRVDVRDFIYLLGIGWWRFIYVKHSISFTNF